MRRLLCIQTGWMLKCILASRGVDALSWYDSITSIRRKRPEGSEGEPGLQHQAFSQDRKQRCDEKGGRCKTEWPFKPARETPG